MSRKRCVSAETTGDVPPTGAPEGEGGAQANDSVDMTIMAVALRVIDFQIHVANQSDPWPSNRHTEVSHSSRPW